jgi:hypothetical protein
VDHHGQVHVVEVAEAHQLLLAAGELEAAGPDLLLAPLDVAALLGRHREEDHAAREVIERARVHQAHRGPEHPGHLRVVAAGVGRPGLGIRLRMPGDPQAVELADHREGRPIARAATDLAAHPGHREAGTRRHPEAPERRLDERGRLQLLEAHLRLLPDALTETDDLLGAPIDRREHLALQLLPGHGRGC